MFGSKLRVISATNKSNYILFNQYSNKAQSPIQRIENQETSAQREAKSFIEFINDYSDKRKFYVKQSDEDHSVLTYMIFKGYTKAISDYFDAMPERYVLFHKARHGYNLIHLAILSGNLNVLKLILKQPESYDLINVPNEYNNYAIHFAARSGDKAILKAIMEHPGLYKNSINKKGCHGYSPLANYCNYGTGDDVSFIEELIAWGAITDEKRNINPIPAELALDRRKPEVTLYLIKHMKDAHLRDHYFRDKAIRNGYTTISKYLAEKCDATSVHNCDFNNSLLKASIPFNDLELMQLAFNIEFVGYDKTSRTTETGFPLPTVDDYLLAAMEALFKIPANSHSMSIYQKLKEFGFDVYMQKAYQKDNIYHMLAKHLEVFVVGNIHAPMYAQPIIDELLSQYSPKFFENRMDKDGNTPSMFLPKLFNKSYTLSFDKKINQYISYLVLEKNNEPLDTEKCTENKVKTEEPVHDDSDKCVIF